MNLSTPISEVQTGFGRSGALADAGVARPLEAGPDLAFQTLLEEASAEPAPREVLREAASQLVASAFIMPLMESAHEGPWATTGPFAPGSAEKRFRPLLDEIVADRVTDAASFDLVDSIVDQLADRLPETMPEPPKMSGSTKDPFAALNGAGIPISRARFHR